MLEFTENICLIFILIHCKMHASPQTMDFYTVQIERPNIKPKRLKKDFNRLKSGHFSRIMRQK